MDEKITGGLRANWIGSGNNAAVDLSDEEREYLRMVLEQHMEGLREAEVVMVSDRSTLNDFDTLLEVTSDNRRQMSLTGGLLERLG